MSVQRAKRFFGSGGVFYASNESFFGGMEQTSMAIINDTDLDDPYSVSKGLSFMDGLASTTPYQPHMFQKAVLDVGKRGKR